MSGSMEIDVKDGIVRITLQGRITETLGTHAILASAEKAAEHSTQKFLYDFRQAVMDESIGSLYARPRMAERAGVSRLSKVAMLCLLVDEKFRFMETSAANQGFRLRVFTDETAALAWLNS